MCHYSAWAKLGVLRGRGSWWWVPNSLAATLIAHCSGPISPISPLPDPFLMKTFEMPGPVANVLCERSS